MRSPAVARAAAAALSLSAAASGCASPGVRGDLAVEPPEVDLGWGFPGGAEFATLEVRNAGDGYLQVDEVRLDDDADGAVTVYLRGWDEPWLLGPGESVPVEVAVAWPEQGPLEARVRVVAALPLTYAGGGLPSSASSSDRESLAGRVEQVVKVEGEVAVAE